MSGRPSSAPSWTWEIWLLMRRPGANRRPAHVLHILDAVVGEVEVDEAVEAAQLQARVGEPGQSAQPRQRPGLGVSVHPCRSTGETRRAVAGQRGQLALRDAEVAEAGGVVRLRAASRDSWPTSSAHWITLKLVWP